MGLMDVEQAVFASSERGGMKGYQLVAKSAGIDRACAQELCRWAPTQMRSDDPADWTINFFPLPPNRVAVTRTVLGGPEYSSRGGTQVVTLILLLNEDQFDVYGCDAIAVAKSAMAMGWMRMPLDLNRAPLPLVELPRYPIFPDTDADREPSSEAIARAIDSVSSGQRVAIIGDPRPLESASQVIARLDVPMRRVCSFSTGLAPVVRRPFQIHFLDQTDSTLNRTLDSQSILSLHA